MKIKKAVAMLCPLALLITSACSGEAFKSKSVNSTPVEQVVYTKKADYVRKNETVYANLSASGELLAVSVTDWLHTDETQVYVDDASDLKNIVNLKSDAMPALPISGGNSLRWYMDTSDIYYSGTTTKSLPLDIKLTYYLNGSEISPQELKGKSGKVRVQADMTNKVETSATVSGKKVKMYLPLAVIGVAVLDEARFSAVTVENGLAIGDASKEIAVTVCFPGMRESLNLEDMGLATFGNYNIADNCAFSADAVDFALGNMYYLIIPLCAMNYGTAVPNSMGELRDDLDRISKIIDAVSDADFTKVMDALAKSPNAINSLESIASDAASLYSSNKELMQLLAKYMTPSNIEAFEGLIGEADASNARKALELLSDPAVAQFLQSLPGLTADMQNVMPVIEELNRDMQDEKIQAQLDNMPQTLKTLGGLIGALEENRALLEALSDTVNSGTLDTLGQVLGQMDGTDFRGDIIKYDKVVENSDALLARLEVWINQGVEYRVFTLAKPEMQTNLLFIYQTKSII